MTYKSAVNAIARTENVTPFRVLGITAFHFVPFHPHLPFYDFEIHGAYVDVKGNHDVIMVLDGLGAWHPLAANRADDMDIAALIYNRLNYARLNLSLCPLN